MVLNVSLVIEHYVMPEYQKKMHEKLSKKQINIFMDLV